MTTISVRLVGLKKLFLQAIQFFAVSGVGWLLDFSVYIFLTSGMNFNVAYANMVSAIPALTFVFTFSTKKIFNTQNTNISKKKKYATYFLYQMILVCAVSFLGERLYMFIGTSFLSKDCFIISNLKLIVKVFITPITMLLNFCVMKILTEKL